MYRGNITIKRTDRTDLINLLELWNCGESMKYVGFPNGLNRTMNDMEQWFKKIQANSDINHFSIYCNEIGYCGETGYGIDDPENRYIGLEIKLLPKAQGLGIAHYALSYIIGEVFSNHIGQVVWVEPTPNNEKALRLYARCGFKESVRPSFLEEGQSYWELTYEDWLNIQSKDNFH